jgi:methyl-accepting chemotaxis protein
MRQRLALLITIGVTGTLAIAVLGVIGLRRANETSASIDIAAHAQRAQMDADMMHDAIRADVLLALDGAARGRASQIADAKGALDADAARFLKDLATVDSTTHGTLAAQVAALRPKVEGYVSDAHAAVSAAERKDPRATEAFDRYLASFEALEGENARFGDAVEKLSADISARASSTFQLVQWLGLVLILVTLVGSLVVGRAAVARMDASLGAIAQGIDQLKDRSIATLRGALAGLAEGRIDLAVRAEQAPLAVGGQDEFSRVADAVNAIIATTGDTIADFTRSQQAVRAVIGDVRGLTVAAKAGELGKRADARAHAGAFREVVAGVNETLDAVTAPMQASLAVLEAMGTRDLTARVTGRFEGDHGRMQAACNRTAEALGGALAEMRASTEHSADAAAQIAQAADGLAMASSQQAARVEEIAAAVQQSASQARTTAAQAQEARRVADDARLRAVAGVAEMEKLSAAVQRMHESSEATARIVRTIDEIAFQTNLLALNAAVEAARAGEAGRGFAVVAEEVRTLAQRAGEAARQTSALIAESAGSVAEGTAITAGVVQQFRGIGSAVEAVTAVVGEIAAANDEQAKGVQQVLGALEDVSRLTQQVAASSEESAAAGQELAVNSAQALSVVSTFTVEAAPAREYSAAA